MRRPRLGLSMGDPAGIGPELVVRCCADPAMQEHYDLIGIGDAATLARAAHMLGLPTPAMIEAGEQDLRFAPGQIAAACGAASLAAIEAGIDLCRAGRLDGLVTAPIHKESIRAAGCPFPGHTELLASRCGVDKVGMLLTDGQLSVALVTIHLALAAAIAALHCDGIIRTGLLLHETLQGFGIHQPRLAMLGLNPHAGEHGLFGDEEARLIEPAIAVLRRQGCRVDGPISPDAAFTPHLRKIYDGHICHYHDQGLIAFKALAFASGVNVTMGLPIVRTSPDHGTAFDIAWQGQAEAASMLAAVRLAARMSEQNLLARE